MSAEEQDKLRTLFRAYDVDNSGRIERNEFLTLCSELQMCTAQADKIFNRLDVGKDGGVSLPEFIGGFQDRYGEDMARDAGESSAAWEDFERRLGEQAKFIPRNEHLDTLYQNISLTEPRLVPHFEKVIINFTKEIKQQNSEKENLALAVKRAQDQATMQLSEMEEEMDQRIHAAESKAQEQEKRRAEATLRDLQQHYEAEVFELQCKIQKMQMIEEKYKNITTNDESTALKKKINELTLENQRLKQEVLKSQTRVACLQSEMDTLKTKLTDQSINSERDDELIKHFSEERDILESQIEILQTANRKLHDSNDGLRSALERTNRSGGHSGSPGDVKDRDKSKSFCYTSPQAFLERFYQRMDEYPLYPKRPSCDTLALAMCDPGLRRRHSSECEDDSLPEIYMDSGMSTLRGSHRGYDSDQDVKGQDEDDMEEKEMTKAEDDNNMMGENSDTETLETLDGESAFGSDTSSVLDWKPSEPLSITELPSVIEPPNPRTRKALSAISAQKKDGDSTDLSYMTSEKAYRIVLAGDAAVGKSSFLLRLCKNEFKLNSSTTLGVDFQMKMLVVDGEPTLLQLWDTAGQERFRSIAKSYFRRADGVLLLYDVTCEKSFLNVREWVDMIEDVSQDDIPIMLIGNKCDLRQGGVSCVPTSYGEKLAMTYNTLFCETSAKDGNNILEAVLHLARQVTRKAHLEDSSRYKSVTNLETPKSKPKAACCT
ncbi:ras and EF-hand domain-containing protein homolog [Thalassophryne amazonica]|uniref:ras and EF-hand domain-containing protein homolog n=1 Tax=Thalassophryne amazonica TaxID=390379 RepID=UPI00147182FC|nr:ras and EF-hand domain-containing protein homolog [Thalassophryne amazonica]